MVWKFKVSLQSVWHPGIKKCVGIIGLLTLAVCTSTWIVQCGSSQDGKLQQWGIGGSRHSLKAVQVIGHSKAADPEQMKSASLNWPEESLSYPMLLIWKIDVLCNILIFLLKCVDGMPTFRVLKLLYRAEGTWKDCILWMKLKHTCNFL